MNFPTHSPQSDLSFDDSYEGNVRCYGNPPKGYRWLKVGDPTTKNTLMVMSNGFAVYNSSDRHPRKEVLPNEWPAIEPIAKTPKVKPAKVTLGTIGDLRRDALVLEIVKRTETDVTFRIVKQRYNDVCFLASNDTHLMTMNFPAVYSRDFCLRGEMKEEDEKLLTCSIERFEEVAAAVQEYNDSVRPKPKVAPTPVPPAPLEQVKTLLLATPEIAADVMRECIRVIADRS